MCGIAGILSPDPAADRAAQSAAAERMALALRHRGPESGGLWQAPDVPVVLAHRRLAIVDLSPLGHQPMESPSGRYVVSFNGEIYNFPDLRAGLEKQGHIFRGRSDTEILLALIDRRGLNVALQTIEGMFAIALWDRLDRTLHLIRDRLGKKPLYVGWAGRALVFGSELKALRAHPDFTPRIDRTAADLYFHHACIPAPHCIYEGTTQIPPGSRMALPLSALTPGESLRAKIEPYWSAQDSILALAPARRKPLPGGDAACLAAFEEILERCVRDRMVSDVPLGAFLSGGIDSTLVVAMMQKAGNGRTKTYTIGFDEAGFDESAQARAVAAHLGTEHHELRLSPDAARDIIPLLPDIYDEPFADISAIPTFLVSRFAKTDVTVALSGDGGDEMFGGYNRHVAARKLHRMAAFCPAPLRRGLAGLVLARPAQWWDRALPALPQAGDKLYKLASLLPDLSDTDATHDALTGHWARGALVRDLPPPDRMPRQDSATRALSPDTPSLSPAERMMLCDILHYLPDDILVKVDRASMAVALEARAPFLDRRMFDFAWSLPETQKIRNGKGKWLLRQALARHLPPALFERPKQGFAMPVGAWLRGPLKPWAEALLARQTGGGAGGKATGDLLDTEPVTALWRAHQAGHGNHATRLWTFLMFAAWEEKYGAP